MKRSTTLKTRGSVSLLETTYADKSLRVDREKGIIYDVKALGNQSKNGGTYSDAAKADVARLLEGTKSYVGHPDRKNPGVNRSLREWAGVCVGTEVRPDGVYIKEYHVVKSNPMAETLFEAAERFPNKFGMSINGDSKNPIQPDRSGKYVVEGVSKIRSLDVVGEPATTGGLFEDFVPKENRTMKTSIRALLEAADAKKLTRYRLKNLIGLLEMEGGDATSAVMTAPVEMPMDGDGADDEADPQDQVDDAFGALLAEVGSDAKMSLQDKIARATEILTAQDALINGTAPKPGGSATTPTPPNGDATVTESKKDDEKPDPLRTLVEDVARRQLRTECREMLKDGNVEVLPERIKALMEAKDDDHRLLLIGSYPKVKTVPVAPGGVGPSFLQKPRSGSTLVEETAADKDAKPLRGKDLISSIKRG